MCLVHVGFLCWWQKQAQTRAMPAEGPRPMAGCAPAPSGDALHPLCLPRAEAQLLQPAVFLTTLLHTSLTSHVSMAMGPDSIKCLDGSITGNTGRQPWHEAWQTPWILEVSSCPPRPSDPLVTLVLHHSSSLVSRAPARILPRPVLQVSTSPTFPQQPAGAESWGRKGVLARTGCRSHCPLRGTPTHLAAVSEVYRHAVPSWSSAGRSCSLAG